MNVVLIGFMCSGKSRVGEALAAKLGWPHFDTDAMIVKDVGASIADIIKTRGEAAFRDIEKKAVQLVAPIDNSIISTGGGVPMNSENMQALTANGKLVWLQITPETVLKRAGNLASRPLIDPKDPLGSIKARMAERGKFYEQAHYRISVENLVPSAIADKIIEMIPSLAA